MKIISFLVVGACFVTGYFFTQPQNELNIEPRAFDNIEEWNKNEFLIHVIRRGIESNHFDPLKMDDEFSKKVYRSYLDRLDFSKRFFTQDDIAIFEKFELEIDDQIKKDEYLIYDVVNSVFQTRMKEVEGFYVELLSKPYDFSKKHDYELDAEKRDYAKNTEGLRKVWKDYFKYQILVRINGKLTAQEAEDFNQDSVKTFAQIELKAREGVEKSYKDFFRRTNKQDEEDHFATFLTAVTSAYGPHTEYFPPEEKERFDIQISGKLQGIGAQLIDKDGSIQVTRIIPGSASAKQGELEKGDIIMKVAQGEKEPVDIQDMKLGDAVKLIRGEKGTEVRLTIKKKNGNIVVIPIIRDVVVLEESYAKSAIIGEKEKVGYIYLPQFYADFQRDGTKGRMCADDIATEVKKLKEEGIESIILDLRGNGGGSLQEVVKMAGLFIDKGPVVQVKAKEGKPFVMEDKNPNQLYDGELIIMINHFSASASEILAAAMQDYGRGLIVGTDSYGKGTVQRFFGLDQAVPSDFSKFKPLGSVKITTQKFYRINGGATQLKGVSPDILLPDSYNYMDIGEEELDYVMPWDEIQAANYVKYTDASFQNLDKVKKMVKKDVSSDETLKSIEKNSVRFKEQSEDTEVSLELESYRADQKEIKAENDVFKELNKKVLDFEIMPLEADIESFSSDTLKVNNRNNWIKRLKKDVILFETYKIATELEYK